MCSGIMIFVDTLTANINISLLSAETANFLDEMKTKS